MPGALRVHHAGARAPPHRACQHHRTSNSTVDRTTDRRGVSWDTVPRYLLRDRDSIYGEHVQQRIKNMGIEEVKIAPRSPWQNPYCERVIGSIRRECLNDVIVLNAQHLTRLLRSYVGYYPTWRTHRSLAMEAPEPRVMQPPERGPVWKLPEVGGLHHHYERIAA